MTIGRRYIQDILTELLSAVLVMFERFKCWIRSRVVRHTFVLVVSLYAAILTIYQFHGPLKLPPRAFASTETRVKDIVVQHLGVDSEKVVPQANFVVDLGADDLDIVELTLAFEEEFKIQIPENMHETVVKSVDTVSVYIQANK